MSEEDMEKDSTRCANKDCPTNKEAGDDHDMEKESATELRGVEKTQLKGELPGGQEMIAPVQTELKTTFSNNSLDLARIKNSLWLFFQACSCRNHHF